MTRKEKIDAMERGERYDYKRAVYEDVKQAIYDNYTPEEIRASLDEGRDEFAERLYDDLFIDDSVTGNGSGSYWFSTWYAEEALCHNLDLLAEALEEFGDSLGHAAERGAEFCDVSIRCHLLVGAISSALYDIGEEFPEAEEKKEEAGQ